VCEAIGWAPNERTIQRHFRREGLTRHSLSAAKVAFGRFEASRPNELWVGDALHGPIIGRHKAILFAFLDDHSRLVTGYRWVTAEDTVRAEAALRWGLASRGVPGAVYLDNGSPFVSAQLLRACATLGIRLIHSRPGRPEGRGKIERFFRTVRDQFLVEVAQSDIADVARLNQLFSAWVEAVYHQAIHSETKMTPLERYATAVNLAYPTAEALHEAFLWSETRTVTKTATVSLFANTYEVDAALVGRRVELVFDPFDLTDIAVRWSGRPMGTAVPMIIGRHSHPAARPEPGAQPPPPATGIDYLHLVEARADAELGRRISYAGIAPDDDQLTISGADWETIGPPDQPEPSPTTTTTVTRRWPGEYPTTPFPLGFHPHPVHQRPGTVDVAPLRRPRRSRGPDLVVRRRVRHRGRHRRSRRRQNRGRQSRLGRA
jgi:putative transposase